MKGTMAIRRVLALMMMMAGAGAAFAQSPVFTYQGRLDDGGSPANGIYDFRFVLYDAPAAGSVVATDVEENLAVSDGLFTAELNYGANALDGSDFWIQIEVRPGASGGAFTVLGPRQALRPAPYAIQTRGMTVASNFDVNLVDRLYVDESTGFVGINRTNRITGNEFFGVRSPVSGTTFGGMYLSVDDPNGQPFYGYSAGGAVNAYTYYTGVENQWRLWASGTRLAVDNATGNVGIGTTSPAERLDVAGDIALSGSVDLQPGQGIYANNGDLFLGGANVVINLGDSTADDVVIPGDVNLPYDSATITFGEASGSTSPMIQMFAAGTTNADRMVIAHSAGFNDWGLQYQDNGDKFRFLSAGTSAMTVNLANRRVGIGTDSPASALDVAGTARVDVIEIDGGSDLSESFHVDGDVHPGTVLAIDPRRPGQLRVAEGAYNRRVAGIVSGAGGVNTGMRMGQQGSIADGDVPVALTGRVYALCDATAAAIEPGDLLTTADLPGHAMKVTDHQRAQGAVIGKAMTGLAKGERGLVLVLVSLQ